jgi:hypothetical protein
VDGEGEAPLADPGAGILEKKPRMLFCLPVEGAFLAVEEVGVFAGFAGVRAAAAVILVVDQELSLDGCNWEANHAMKAGMRQTNTRAEWKMRQDETRQKGGGADGGLPDRVWWMDGKWEPIKQQQPR